jgi:hypothetical protein
MGGNIWSTETRRVTKQEAQDTIVWLQRLVGIPLWNNMLGSTGLAETSGDIDLGVSADECSPHVLKENLEWWACSKKLDPRKFVKRSGICVHFKAPILGDVRNGFVQTDFMFGDDLEWMKFAYRANIPEGSPYKGFHRHILMSSIIKAINPEWKWNQNIGIVRRAKPVDTIITTNPEGIAQLLLGPGVKVSDLDNVESIMKALENDPIRDLKVKDFVDNIAKHPLK